MHRGKFITRGFEGFRNAFMNYNGSASDFRVTDGRVYLLVRSAEPVEGAKLFLVRLTPDKDDGVRSLKISSFKQRLRLKADKALEPDTDVQIRTSVTKVSDGLWRVAPVAPLAPGEYGYYIDAGFINLADPYAGLEHAMNEEMKTEEARRQAGGVFDFAVDPPTSSSVTAATSADSEAVVPSAVTNPPREPSVTPPPNRAVSPIVPDARSASAKAVTRPGPSTERASTSTAPAVSAERAPAAVTSVPAVQPEVQVAPLLSATDPDIEEGISSAREGRFEEAVVTLNRVGQRLASQGSRSGDLARARLYMAFAYFGLGLNRAARTYALEALRLDPNVAITARKRDPMIYAFVSNVSAEPRGGAASPTQPQRSASSGVIPGPTQPAAVPARPSPVLGSPTAQQQAAPVHQATTPASMELLPARSSGPLGGRDAGTVRVNPTDGLEYVWVPQGSFDMGAECEPGPSVCRKNETPVHRVTLTRGFWLARTEVTVAAYRRFLSARSSPIPKMPDYMTGSWLNDDHPMIHVTSDEALAFCNWAGGRLPTEAEWEYAARGGGTGLTYPYPWGTERPSCTKGSPSGARFAGCAGERETDPVGSYGPNTLGLYDMAGNVWEWCADRYDEKYYATSPATDPLNTVGRRSLRALRGGAWSSSAEELRVSSRYYGADNHDDDQGFRCALDAGL